MRRWLKRLVTPPLLLVAALFFLVEGALWRLAACWAWIGKLPVLRRVERAIAGLPPYGALLIFAFPSLCLAPIKFLALYWMAGGHPSLGFGTIVAAKVAGTALVARLYQLTRPALVTLGWFAWCERRVLDARRLAYDWWRSSWAGRWIAWRWRAFREQRTQARSWFFRRWLAIRQWFQRGGEVTGRD